MKYSEEYINKFVKISMIIMNNNNYEYNTPYFYLNNWFEWIEWLYEGYDFTYMEFEDDLMDREEVEKLLINEELIKYSEHSIFAKKINILDEFYKKITVPSPESYYKAKYWWENRILKYAKKGYIGLFERIDKITKPIEEMKKDNELMQAKEELSKFEI